MKEASTFRRARGLSPYPAINYPDPYFQSVTYDAFDHSNRTGKLYTGEPSDIGTYVNNRRTGWQYDADGNTVSDTSYQQTIDAVGVPVRSLSHAMVGDGIQHPLEPRLDITQTYDGTGTPAKRVQISRLPGVVDEFGNPGEPIEDTQTTHYVKSTVLGGATVAELGSGDTIHIYAGGQRIAREIFGNVTFEHHNPLTGSWVTSHGHSSYRTTNREERDPRGAETPLSNPYGYAENYVEWKFGQPLFIDGNDPFDYVSGYTKDGLPMTRGDLGRIMGKLGPAGFLLFDVYKIPKAIFWADEYEDYLSEFYAGTTSISVNRLLRGNTQSLKGKIAYPGMLQKSAAQQKSSDEFTPEQLAQFKTCLSAMFKVYYDGHKYQREGEAYFDGHSDSRRHFFSLFKIGSFRVRTDQQGYSMKDLGRKADPAGVGRAGGKLVAGYTDRSNPYVNAIANDAGLVLKGREFLGLWVFELGNALSVITNISPRIPSDSFQRYAVKDEAGAAFEDCVFGGKLNPSGSVDPPKP